MKKFFITLLPLISISSFAVSTTATSAPAVDVNKLECHCEKHQMIFELKDGESLTEMSKHCTMNVDKKNSMVKFLDDNSGQTVKCNVQDGKLEINTCKPFKHKKSSYSRSSQLSESNNLNSH